MRMLLVVCLLSACSACLAQEIKPGPLLPQDSPQEQAAADRKPSTITVPEGARVQLALANPIHTRDARVGDTVRAVTTFPVTVGQDLAIPQGAYLEGAIARIGKRGSTRFDGLEIRFRQVVFTNGYNVTLDSSVVEAMGTGPTTQTPGSAPASPPLIANSFQQQPPTPTPPPLPQVGPSKALVTGVGIAAVVGVMATVGILSHRHHGGARDFDTGFQFEIVLQSPLTLDSARVAAAVGASQGQ